MLKSCLFIQGLATSLTIGSGREPCCVLQVPGFDMISTCSLSCRDKQRDVKWMAMIELKGMHSMHSCIFQCPPFERIDLLLLG